MFSALSTSISDGSLATLNDGEELDDEVINHYMAVSGPHI